MPEHVFPVDYPCGVTLMRHRFIDKTVFWVVLECGQRPAWLDRNTERRTYSSGPATWFASAQEDSP